MPALSIRPEKTKKSREMRVSKSLQRSWLLRNPVKRKTLVMCCDGWYYPDSKVGQCPACDGDVNSDGDATQGCNYSPIQCDLCGARPCDDSC